MIITSTVSAKARICKRCAAAFPVEKIYVGGVWVNHRARRSDAIFCSTKCKVDYHNAEKSK